MTTMHVSGALDSGPLFLRLVKTMERLRAGRPGRAVVPVGYGRPDPWHRASLPDLSAHPTPNGALCQALDQKIRAVLLEGGLWLAGHPAEAIAVPPDIRIHPGYLGPSPDVIADHRIALAALVDGDAVRAWPAVACSDGEAALHRFGRRWGWQVDIETPTGVVATISDRRSATAALNATGCWPATAVRIAPTWERFHEIASLASADPGTWETTSFSLTAHRGQLLSLVALTGAGRVVDADDTWRRRAVAAARRLAWTGSAEIEVCGPPSGPSYVRRWAMGPPLWSFLGAHDPGVELLAAATGDVPSGTVRVGAPDVSLPEPQPDDEGRCPSDLEIDALLADLAGLEHVDREPTPFYCVLPGIVSGLWGRARDEVEASSRRSGPVAEISYSVKTNPAAPLLREARNHGFLAEAISQAEVAWAADNGFEGASTILNGPGKWWPPAEEDRHRYRAILADSLPELEATAPDERGDGAEFVGVRLRPTAFSSRFGEPVHDEATRAGIAAAFRTLPPGVRPCVSFHVNSHWVGWHRWWRSLTEVLTATRDIERQSGRPIEMVDIGGGWHPDDWYTELLPELHTLEEMIAQRLPAAQHLVLEPGKALCQPVCALVGRVLEVRPSRGEIVVDCSVAELQAALAYPRRRAWRPSSGDWTAWGSGAGRVLGRLCMENDILATDVALPAGLSAGDLVAFGDTGAYDMSMSYGFARGGAGANSYGAWQLGRVRGGDPR